MYSFHEVLRGTTGGDPLVVDVIGAPAGLTGWGTHTVNFAQALGRLTSVRLHTDASEAARHREVHGPGDFGVVVLGEPFVPERSARWIVWETTELPYRQRVLCDATRFLWTPSRWGRETLIANGIEAGRVAVVPEGVDTDFFHPGPRGEGRFRFLSVGKWENRKYPDGLLRAFIEEFGADETVELYLHAHNPYIPGFSLAEAVGRTGLPDTGNIVLGEPCSLTDLRALYRSADCFVLPTRAEGWGLPILEAMACGLPAIVTAYSAPADYIDEANGYPLRVAGMVEAHDATHGIATGLWAEPDLSHLRALMRRAFREREELREKGRHARATAESLSWNASAEIALRTMARAIG
jgi:glycosyltransferase involved in cell wall biosynthesis